MMKRVFLDTNILIDYVLGRERGDDAKQLLQRGLNGEISLAVSFLTLANMAYILGRKLNVYELFRDLSSYISILAMDGQQFQAALNQEVHDFEDMLQYQCAVAGDCYVIITNNVNDFSGFCDIPFMTAAEFLSQLDKQ